MAFRSPNLATRAAAVDVVRSLPDAEANGVVFTALIEGQDQGPGYTSRVSKHIRRPLGPERVGQIEAVLRLQAGQLEAMLKPATGKYIETSPSFRASDIRGIPAHAAADAPELKIDPEKVAFKMLVFSVTQEMKNKWDDPGVYREALLNLRQIPAAPGPMSMFYALAQKYDGKDIFYRTALNIACGTDPARRDAILADFDKHFPDWNDTVADLVWELRPKAVLAKLPAKLTDPKLTAAQKARVVDILATDDAPAAGRALLGLLGSDAPAEVQTRALANLRLFLPTKWNELAKGADIKTAVGKLLADPATAATGLQLVAAANFAPAVADAETIAADAGRPLPVRAEAVRTLGQLRDASAVDALVRVGTPANPLSADAMTALGQHVSGSKPNPRAMQALQKAVTVETSAPEVKAAALTTLAGTRAGTGWLLQLKEKGEMPAALVADAGTLLRNSPYQGERNRALALFPLTAKLNLKALPSPAVLAQRPGDADRGKAVMAKTAANEVQCLKCHAVNGTGGAIGPDLSSVGIKGSKENLFESILQPSKAIADQYLTWTIDTVDGQTITGLVVAESESTVTVRDANGKDYPIPVKDIDRRKKSPLSLMPDNLAAGLTEDELADLVAYLTTLKAPPPAGK